VAGASVEIDGSAVAGIGPGLLLLTGFGRGDDASVVPPMADKITGLRVFEDRRGRFQYSVNEAGGDILAVPQFTLYGDTRRGRRPDFTAALEPPTASALFDEFAAALRGRCNGAVETGRFGAHMKVGLVNDGPVTLMLERGA